MTVIHINKLEGENSRLGEDPLVDYENIVFGYVKVGLELFSFVSL